ncbi:MAG: hypothetical protein WCT99_11475 [Bacteroidota bacterium]|jgi:hypothetical protein
MAKQQSFEEKVKKLAKEQAGKTVKFVAAIKTPKGTYRFNQKLVKVKDEKTEEAILEAEYKRMVESA